MILLINLILYLLIFGLNPLDSFSITSAHAIDEVPSRVLEAVGEQKKEGEGGQVNVESLWEVAPGVETAVQVLLQCQLARVIADVDCNATNNQK